MASRAAAMVKVVPTLGVISDTHGLLRPEARKAMGQVDGILHAGDFDEPGILQRVAAWGPLTAVRGNMDRGAWARGLPERAVLTVDGFIIHVLHDVHQLALDPEAEGIAVVVSGHTHRPRNELQGSVLYFNPGSAGPRRRACPVSVGKLHLSSAGVRGEIILLEPF